MPEVLLTTTTGGTFWLEKLCFVVIAWRYYWCLLRPGLPPEVCVTIVGEFVICCSWDRSWLPFFSCNWTFRESLQPLCFELIESMTWCVALRPCALHVLSEWELFCLIRPSPIYYSWWLAASSSAIYIFFRKLPMKEVGLGVVVPQDYNFSVDFPLGFYIAAETPKA